MRRVSLRTLLLLSHGFVFALPLAALLLTGALGRDLLEQRRDEVEHLRAMLQQTTASMGPFPRAAQQLAPVLPALHAESLVGIRLLDVRGVVIASSGPRLGEDLSDRPEVAAALAGQSVTRLRKGVPGMPDDRRRWLFSAGPVEQDGAVVGVVLLTRRTRETGEALADLSSNMPRGLVGVLLLTVLTGLTAGTFVARSMRRLSEGAERIASGGEGELRALQDSRLAEVAALATSVDRMNRRLQERLRTNREYASNISHEFKNPLTTLRGTVHLLQTDPDMPPEQRQRFLTNAAVDLDRMVEMVSGLLLLARIEAGHSRAPVPLDELAAEVLARFPAVALTGEGGTVDGDAAQLEIALSNLVENALTHGAEPVTVALWCREDAVGLTVTDAGPGIPAELQAQVFERFFTTDRAGDGTGLGLAIVAAIVEAHGGQVRLQSAGGCEVMLVFPVA